MELTFGDRVVKITSTDRVVFPDCGVTKGDLLKYYAEVSSLVLPEIRDRPLTLERFTGNIVEGGFFQKHAQKYFPPWIERVRVNHKKRPFDYPLITDAASLLYLVNQGGYVLHVWCSRQPQLEHPDLLVLDLDPPEGRFDLAREVALQAREIFAALELPAFVKTTGSRGLHVVAPLDGHDTYEDVARVMNLIAKTLLRRCPAITTQEMMKKDRGDRVFVDTGRIIPSATYAAAYTVRGRPGAPVSAPVEWSELATVTPDGISLRDVPRRLDERGDPWASLRSTPGSARQAYQRVTSA